MKDAWRHFAAEFIGTFALVFIGGGAIITSPLLAQQAAVVNIAFAHGLILALMVTATMHISGHLNPAVTAGFLVTRRIEPMMAVVYWIAQITGAIVAAYTLKALYPPAIVAVTRLGGQSISADINADPGDRARGDRDVLPRVRGVRHGGGSRAARRSADSRSASR